MSQLSKFNEIIDQMSVADALTPTGQQIVANAIEAISLIHRTANKTNALIEQNAERIERLLDIRDQQTTYEEASVLDTEIDRLTEVNEGLHEQVADLVGEGHNWEDRVA